MENNYRTMGAIVVTRFVRLQDIIGGMEKNQIVMTSKGVGASPAGARK